MRIMDFMSFDLSWFKSLPGILLILGCFCLIIAIILIPTLTRKKDEFEVDLDPKEGEELLNRPEDLGMLSTNQSIPVNTPMQEEIKQEIPAAPSPIMEEIKVEQPVVNTTPIEVEKPKVVEEVGATSMKDMGKVMAKTISLVQGRADGKRINAMVKQILG